MSTPGRAHGLGGFVLASALVIASHARADDAASTLPPPPLALSIIPGTGLGPWKLRIENTGDVPMRLAADPRLLVLEVTPPAGFVDPTVKAKPGAAAKKAEEAKPVRCVLPDDARPATDEGHDLVVPPKRSWSQSIDPLMYCFGARERAMLVTGATVQAHFGWPTPPPKPGARPAKKPAPPGPPFVAAPVGAALGKIASAKELLAAPVTLTENAKPALSASTATSADSPSSGLAGSGSMAVSMADAVDVARGAEISAAVTIANEGDKPVMLLFRAETLRFAVSGPAGSVSCGATRPVGSPIRELYSTLGVKGRASITILITSMCPADTFDRPGVYRVTPVLDTSGASGRSIGLKTWDGAVAGPGPMLLRVRSPRRPSQPSVRPALD